MKKQLLFIIISLITGVSMAQQLPKFVAVNANPYLINPAYAGFKDETQVFLHHRNEMLGVRGAPVTSLISADGRYKESKVGLGLNIFSDRVNIIDRKGINLSYAYRLKLSNEQKLSFGISGGIVNNSIASSEIIADSPSELVLLTNYKPTKSFNNDFGIVYSIKELELGISAVNFFNTTRTSKYDFAYEQKPTYLLSGIYTIELNPELKSKNTLVFRSPQGLPIRFDLSSQLIIKDKIMAGISYGINSNAGLNVGIVHNNLMFVYAYEYPASIFSSISDGSHEVFIGLKIK